MAVDYYPDEEGHISDGLVIGFAKCVGTIVQNAAVKFGVTAVSGYASILASAADADSFAVALKGGSANEYIPVCFYGVVKMYSGSTLTAGDIVINDSSGLFVLGNTMTDPTCVAYLARFQQGGSMYHLGLAMQNASAGSGGELLVLVGGIR